MPDDDQKFGLGDAVAKIAEPIARAYGAITHKRVVKCGKCKRRQQALNRLVPDLRIGKMQPPSQPPEK